ncbi:MAG: hypothetical protein ACKN9T_06250 [Candidatus Methylumidiphilus sp.]
MSNDKWQHPKNDGWQAVAYDFGAEPELQAVLNRLLNEACHVFYCHADGNWETLYKDKYANQLAKAISENPWLIHRLLGSGDRVVKMLTYRAISLAKQAADTSPTGI